MFYKVYTNGDLKFMVHNLESSVSVYDMTHPFNEEGKICTLALVTQVSNPVKVTYEESDNKRDSFVLIEQLDSNKILVFGNHVYNTRGGLECVSFKKGNYSTEMEFKDSKIKLFGLGRIDNTLIQGCNETIFSSKLGDYKVLFEKNQILVKDGNQIYKIKGNFNNFEVLVSQSSFLLYDRINGDIYVFHHMHKVIQYCIHENKHCVNSKVTKFIAGSTIFIYLDNGTIIKDRESFIKDGKFFSNLNDNSDIVSDAFNKIGKSLTYYNDLKELAYDNAIEYKVAWTVIKPSELDYIK